MPFERGEVGLAGQTRLGSPIVGKEGPGFRGARGRGCAFLRFVLLAHHRAERLRLLPGNLGLIRAVAALEVQMLADGIVEQAHRHLA